MAVELRFHILEMTLRFERPVILRTYPSFYFRSLLGKELFRLICPFRKKMCESCTLRFKCAYSFIFESPITRDNPVLYGRNFASHPFVLETDIDTRKTIEVLTLRITLIGQAKEYIPIVFWSLVKAGENGIFKSKVRYQISDLKINGQNSFADERLKLPKNCLSWKLEEDNILKNGKLFLEFLTPMRFKKNGKYLSELQMEEVMQAAVRRLEILTATYGDQEFRKIGFPEFKLKEEHSQLNWKDLPRWSARQKQLMRLGGVVGYLTAEGSFSLKTLSLLKGAEIFHFGKNTSFGLGKIKVTFVEGEVHD